MSTDISQSSESSANVQAPAGNDRDGGVADQLLDAPHSAPVGGGRGLGTGLGGGKQGMPDMQLGGNSDIDPNKPALLQDEQPLAEPLNNDIGTDQGPTEIPPDVIERAEMFGVSKDDLGVFGGDMEAINAYLANEERLVLGHAGQMSFPAQPGMVPQGQQWAPPQQPMQNPGMMGQPRPQGQQQLPPGLQPYQFDLDPMEYDEKLRTQLQGLAQHHHAQVVAQHNFLMGLAGAMQQQQSAAQEQMRYAREVQDHNEFHGWLGKLSDEFQAIFGKGDHTQVKDGTAYYRNRAAVYNEFQQIRDGYMARGLRPPSSETMLRTAAQRVLGDSFNYFEQRAKSNRNAGRRGQMLSRPSQRQGQELTGREKAARFAQQFYSERGYDTPRMRAEISEQDQLL